MSFPSYIRPSNCSELLHICSSSWPYQFWSFHTTYWHHQPILISQPAGSDIDPQPTETESTTFMLITNHQHETKSVVAPNGSVLCYRNYQAKKNYRQSHHITLTTVSVTYTISSRKFRSPPNTYRPTTVDLFLHLLASSSAICGSGTRCAGTFAPAYGIGIHYAFIIQP
jgi:hypothetical protein